MSDLVVIGYATKAEADEVMGVLRGLERDRVIHTCGSAVVVRDDDGELRVATSTHATSAGAPSGGLWGMVIGMLFFMPAGATEGGGAMGALFGKMSDLGISDDFRSQVAGMLKPGSAAVVMLFQRAKPGRTIEALAPYGGTVLETSLSSAAEQHLTEALSADHPSTLTA